MTKLSSMCQKAKLTKNHSNSFEFSCKNFPIPRQKTSHHLEFDVLGQTKLNKLHLTVSKYIHMYYGCSSDQPKYVS